MQEQPNKAVPRGRYNLDALVAELRRRTETSVDFTTNTRKLAVRADRDEEGKETGTAQLVPVGSQEWFDSLGALRINDHAHGQIAAETGIPRTYYDRMLAEHGVMFEQNVNYWWQVEPKQRMVRTLDGHARAFLSDRYRRLDNVDVLASVLPTLAAPDVDWRFTENGLTDRRMYLRAILWDRRGEVKVGDEVAGGIILRNSEVGAGALAVEPFLHRLVCSNGMVVPVGGMKRRHIGGRADDDIVEFLSDATLRADDRLFMQKVAEVIQALASKEGFDRIISSARLAAGVEIEKPVETSKILAKTVGLLEHEHETVLNNYVAGGDTSVWGMLNALTRTARDLSDYDRKVDVERETGRLLAAGNFQQIAKVA